jgi:glycosyltransferase involved in cell wall biosynthesis
MTEKPLNILHVLLEMGETSAPYNQHSLPVLNEQKITICTYLVPQIIPVKGIILFAGDNTLRGFFRALRTALDAQEYDIIHAHSVHVATLLLFAKYFLRWKLTSHLVYTFHSSYPNYKLRNKLMLILTIIFFRRVVCCSYASLDSLPNFWKRFARHKLCVVQNGIDINRIDQAIETSTNCYRNNVFTITVVGRLIESKNPFSILKSFQQSDNHLSQLVFIGEGNLSTMLQKEIREQRLERRVELTGLIPREKVYDYLAKTDLFISASLSEGLPVAVLEAMASYCPVVLSDIPPHREIATGINFIPLIPTNDVGGFSREIKNFQEMPALERTRIGKECRKLVEDRFSLSKMHKEYRSVYAQLLQ